MNWLPEGFEKTTRRGFSLLELLAAVSILVVMLILLSLVFAATGDSWQVGVDQTESSAAGRAAVDKIADDLRCAVADDLLSFVIRPDKNRLSPYGVPADEICFVSLQHDSHDGQRTAREIFYYLRKDDDRPGLYNLVRGYYGKSIADSPGRHCYGAFEAHGREWYDVAGRPGGRPQLIAENVAALSFFASTLDEMGQAETTRDYASRARCDTLPFYVDIYLEVLEAHPARQLSLMLERGQFSPDSQEAKMFVEQHLTRYTKRVHFQNRNGYRRRFGP